MLVRLAFLSVQVAAAVAVVAPLLAHAWMNRRWMRRPAPMPAACGDGELPHLTLVVPTWNEANVIEAKFSNLGAQRYPEAHLRWLLVDSASTDDTVPLARAWAADAGVDLEVIEMPARLGKSAAVNRALAACEPEEILVMTDAEATLDPGALRRIGRWMRDASIGAVCGTIAEEADGRTYRGWYRWFREGESRIDSTPIFEGSVAAYRVTAVNPIHEGANADDSQLAIQVRAAGLRAISDPAIRFREQPITDPSEARQRTLRRAQGLSRHFWRVRGRWFRDGTWGRILGLNGLQHTLTPWAMVLGLLAGIGHATSVVLVGWTGAEATLLDRGALLVDSAVLAGLAFGISGLPVRLFHTMRAYLAQNLFLAWGMALMLTGRSLHRWEPSRSNRQRI